MITAKCIFTHILFGVVSEFSLGSAKTLVRVRMYPSVRPGWFDFTKTSWFVAFIFFVACIVVLVSTILDWNYNLYSLTFFVAAFL